MMNHYCKSELHWLSIITDYGAKRVILKCKNKILGYVESYPKYTGVEEERNKFFYSVGKPSENHEQYVVDTIEEGKNSLEYIWA